MDIFTCFSRLLMDAEAMDTILYDSDLTAEMNPVVVRRQDIGASHALAHVIAKHCGCVTVGKGAVIGTGVSVGLWATHWPRIRKGPAEQRRVLTMEASSPLSLPKSLLIRREARVAQDRVLHTVANTFPKLRIWPDEKDYDPNGLEVQLRKNVKNLKLGGCIV